MRIYPLITLTFISILFITCKKDKQGEQPVYPELKSTEISSPDYYISPIGMVQTDINTFTLLAHKKNLQQTGYTANYMDVAVDGQSFNIINDNEVFSGLSYPPTGTMAQYKTNGFSSILNFSKGGYTTYFINGTSSQTLGASIEKKDLALTTIKKLLVLDDGYLVLGEQKTFLFVQKLDFNLNEVWEHTFGGPAKEVAKDIVQLGDGNIGIMAETKNGGNGFYSIWWLRLTANGDSLSSSIYSNTSTTQVFGACPVDGKVYVIAKYFEGGSNQRVLFCITEAGEVLWKRKYGEKASFSRISETKNGFLITGTVKDNLGNDDFYVSEIDENGNILWDKSYGDNNYNEHIITQIVSGDYYYLLASKYKLNGKYSTIFIKDKLGN